MEFLCFSYTAQQKQRNLQQVITYSMIASRVAELGSLSARAKIATTVFVRHILAVLATNALFLRVIANLQI